MLFVMDEDVRPIPAPASIIVEISDIVKKDEEQAPVIIPQGPGCV